MVLRRFTSIRYSRSRHYSPIAPVRPVQQAHPPQDISSPKSETGISRAERELVVVGRGGSLRSRSARSLIDFE